MKRYCNLCGEGFDYSLWHITTKIGGKLVVVWVCKLCKDDLKEQQPNKNCLWKEEDDGEYWTSECGNGTFTFTTGNPHKNGFRFCPYCGHNLILIAPSIQDKTKA